MDLSYVLTPCLAWVASGSLKFFVNSVKAKRLAFDLIGYGGLPSTHSTLVSSMAAIIALKNGVEHPAFGVALTLAIVVVLDAKSLRRQVGRHAEAINQLTSSSKEHRPIMRERMGHTSVEIVTGVLLGIGVATTVWLAFG